MLRTFAPLPPSSVLLRRFESPASTRELPETLAMALHHVMALLVCVLAPWWHPLVVQGHGDTGSTGPPCLRNPGASLQAAYVPGSITIDGLADDWSSVPDSSFSLVPALSNDANHAYSGGSMKIKVAHDGQEIFFLLQIPGAYAYNNEDPHNMASVALMFPIGDDATYHNMGGCPESSGTCNSTSCFGHEVDLMHFEVNKAIPGRLYGGNIFDNINGTGKDSFGNLNDGYAWNPHCRYFDGNGPTGATGGGSNNWRGSWTHSTMDTSYGLVVIDSPYGKVDSTGTYTFEFARSLRTNDVLQQDFQFTIGQTQRMAAAFWYPVNGGSWQPYDHYSATCDWLPLELLPGVISKSENKSGTAFGTFSLLVSLASLAVAVAVAWWVRQSSKNSFVPINTTQL